MISSQAKYVILATRKYKIEGINLLGEDFGFR